MTLDFRGMQSFNYKQLLYLSGIFFILLLPHILWGIQNSEEPAQLLVHLTGIIKYLFVFSVPFLFLKIRHACWVLFAGVILYPLEIGSIYIIGNYINVGTLGMILNTNSNEAFELFEIIIPVLIISGVLLAAYLFLLSKVGNGRAPLWFRLSLIGISLFWIVRWEVIFIQNSQRNNKPYYFLENSWLQYKNMPPLNIFHKTYETVRLNALVKSVQADIASFTYSAKKKNQITEKEIYVLVIGESCRYSNWGINGYHRNTSPFLSSRTNLVSFSNCYSNANSTSISLPLLMTGSDGGEFDAALARKTFVTAFKEAGFKTSWISNQHILAEEYSAILTDIDKMYDMAGLDKDNYDEKVLPFLDEVLSDTARKQFIVINIMGNHVGFEHRHPESFEFYKPNLKDKYCTGASDREYFVNSYDNSIQYTDYILSEVISRVKSKTASSFVLYCADHGESLFDDGTNNFCHSSENPPPYQVHVPLFVWYSSLYQNLHSEKIDNLTANRDKKMANNVIMYSILDLADIAHQFEDTLKSLAKSSFKEPAVRKVRTPEGKIIPFR